MRLIGIKIPELDRLPVEQRVALVQSFNESAETAELKSRLAKLPSQTGTVLACAAIGVLSVVLKWNLVPCMVAGAGFFMAGVPIGMFVQLVQLKQALRRFVQEHAADVEP